MNTNKYLRGFTLIELLVSISIVGVLMSIILFNYGTFNDNLALTSAAQEVAIVIREAQAYGINVKETGVSSGQFNSGYGIFFNPSCSYSSNYYFFIDTDADGKYDFQNGNAGCGNPESPQDGDIMLAKNTLRNGIYISDICVTGGVCASNSSGIKRFNITFVRPNPDAKILFTDNNGNNSGSFQQSAILTLTSPKGKSLSVVVLSTGQISIQ